MDLLQVTTHVLLGMLAIMVMVLLGMFFKLWRQDREEAKWILFGVYAVWMAIGWVPGVLLSIAATNRIAYEGGLGIFAAYGLSWLVSVCVFN
jgi:hypothetical protein